MHEVGRNMKSQALHSYPDKMDVILQMMPSYYVYHSRMEKSFGNPRYLHVVFFADVTRSRELDEGRGQVIRVARTATKQQHRVNDSGLFTGQ